MSSRKAAATKARPASSAKPKAKPVAVKPKVVASNGVSADAIRLAGEIERAFAKSDSALTPEAMQALMSALCRVYAAQVENGARYTPIPEGQAVSPTGVMLTA